MDYFVRLILGSQPVTVSPRICVCLQASAETDKLRQIRQWYRRTGVNEYVRVTSSLDRLARFKARQPFPEIIGTYTIMIIRR